MRNDVVSHLLSLYPKWSLKRISWERFWPWELNCFLWTQLYAQQPRLPVTIGINISNGVFSISAINHEFNFHYLDLFLWNRHTVVCYVGLFLRVIWSECGRINYASFKQEKVSRVQKYSSPISMEFHGTWWQLIWRWLSSMEFHGIFHGIPWNHSHFKWHGTSSMEFHETWWHLFWQPKSSVEYWKEVQGNLMSITTIISKFHGIPSKCVTSDLAAAEFHWISWNSSLNSMEP